MNWTDLDQDRKQWRALVNKEINFQVPKNIGKLLTKGSVT
jgi:hypothetical protein